MITRLLAVIFAISVSDCYAEPQMTQKRMEHIIKQMVDQAQGQQGVVRLAYQGIKMGLISDVKHDRMRMIAPVANYSDMTEAQKIAVLRANFHSALDARYAESDGILYSVFLHPLSSLTSRDLRSALKQVATLAKTFGSTYTSGLLSFRQAPQ